MNRIALPASIRSLEFCLCHQRINKMKEVNNQNLQKFHSERKFLKPENSKWLKSFLLSLQHNFKLNGINFDVDVLVVANIQYIIVKVSGIYNSKAMDIFYFHLQVHNCLICLCYLMCWSQYLPLIFPLVKSLVVVVSQTRLKLNL